MCSTTREVEERAVSTDEPGLVGGSLGLARGRSDYAARLAGLKDRLAARATRPLSLAFIGVGEVSDGIRLGVPVAGLNALGNPAMVARSLSALDLDRYDAFVFARPQLSANGLRDMQQIRRLGKRLVVDLDDDFYAIPPDHPGYRGVGPGNPGRMQALEAALALADLVVVATPALADRYRPLCNRLDVIPNGWSRSNPLWEQAAPQGATFNVGWAGTPTHRADVGLLVREVVDFMHKTPQAQLVIGGDAGIWHLFADLPEERRSFASMMPFEAYPSLLAHFDVLLAPLCDNDFNNAKSDIKLLEAGIRRIPWVASPRAAYRAWGVGGLFAEAPGEWQSALTRLAQDANLRRQLGQDGRERANTREARSIAERWLAALGLNGA